MSSPDAPDLDARVTKWLADDNLHIDVIAGRLDEDVVTMVAEQHAALRAAETKLAAIHHLADNGYTYADHVPVVVKDELTAILNGKGEPT